jgi:hypothetical protein
MFKACQVVIAIGFLLCGCTTTRNACAQATSAGNTGYLWSPTEDIYLSNTVTVTSTAESVILSGTPLSEVFNVFYCFMLSVDGGCDYPWEITSSNTITSTYGYPSSVYLDGNGNWSIDGNLSTTSPFLAFGSHTAYATTSVGASLTYNPPTISFGPGSLGISDVTFDIY